MITKTFDQLAPGTRPPYPLSTSTTTLETLQTGFIQTNRKTEDAIRAELGASLLAPQAHTSPKYLYDELGSKLFAAICELPEYYPTRTEAAIFEMYRSDIAQSVGRSVTLIDLGAGDCAKAARLIPLLLPEQYVPVDISVDFLRDAVGHLQQRFPQTAMLALGMDFSDVLELPVAVRPERRLFFYPGSSIGNFTPDQALVFLRRLRTACEVNGRTDGGLLIGVDLVKDTRILDAAYDDALGVTAAFNLNLLLHLNKLLGANFDVRDWRHRGYFNTEQSRIEMHLKARRPVNVSWQGGQRRFGEGDTIHTENSYKYTQRGFVQLLEQAGFGASGIWTDPKGWFMLCHARAID
jgi:dimethylhistidine N-methyltransferase